MNRLAAAAASVVMTAGGTVLVSTGGAFAAGGPASSQASAMSSAADWTSAGQNGDDTHYAAAETEIGTGNAGGLAPKWTLTTGGSISATPTVVNGQVYAPDWAGDLYDVDSATGQVIWQRQVSDYTGVTGDLSRVSPAYADGEIVIGDGAQTNTTTAGAFISGIDAATGGLNWNTQVESDPTAIITGSPVIVDGVVYVGVSSKTEDLTTPAAFRGSVVALDATTGKILWKTFMVPADFPGGAVWGSTPVVDTANGLVYVGTGNNYTSPPGFCTSPADTNCESLPSDDMQDSIVALNAKTGAVAWSTPTLTADSWTIAQQFGPDFDFGSGANLFTADIDGTPTQLLGIGQKSGVYWALNPQTGKIVWDTAVGPGGGVGGLEWGTATDGNQILVANTNSDDIPTTITSATGRQTTTTNGFWASLNAATGQIQWETAVPGGPSLPDEFAAYSQVSLANGVMYAGSINPSGDNMYALNEKTGTIEWSFASGGSVVGGAAIVDGTVYWGSGYHTAQLGLPFDGNNDKLYAFAVPATTPAPQTVYVSNTASSTGAGTSCTTAGFSSINAAINAVASGGEVMVCNGTYTEDVAVNKPLSLQSQGNVTIDATGQPNGIDVTASNVSVNGFTVENADDDGILVDSADKAVIEDDNSLDDAAGAGIHLVGSSDAQVLSNTVNGNAAGIVISDETGPSSGNTVNENIVTDNADSDGISLVSRNTAAAPGGTAAPSVGGVFGNTVENNQVNGNGLTTAGAGIALTATDHGEAVYDNTLSDNIISSNGESGITVHSLAAAQDMTGNTIQANTVGTDNTVGDNAGTPADTQTTGILIRTVSPLTIKIVSNVIGDDDTGIWTAGPVTAANAATANQFSAVTVPVLTN
jgi:polyvinyl alcohol dehydrogenase (cytochrome)